MSFRSFKYLVLAAPFLLTACGEGYEMIKTDTMFPYGNQRTAGSGVAYVLARMAPEKELVLETKTTVTETAPPPAVAEPPPAPAPEPEPPKDDPMEKVFNEAHDK